MCPILAVQEQRNIGQKTGLPDEIAGARVRLRLRSIVVFGRIPGRGAPGSVDHIRRGRRTRDGGVHAGNIRTVYRSKSGYTQLNK